MEPKIATVSQINGYVKKILDHNIILNNVWIKGEISNFKHHYSGHLYITLKDEGGVLKAVMFRGSAQSLNFEPSDGMKVLARGRVSVYEAGGSYQLYIEEMIPDGVGELYIAYEQLKKQLEEEGLFRPEHKKPIPKFPKRVGVVTASTGAAVRDIINVITRRYPMAEIVIYPAQVQGVGAAESVVKAIEYFNATNEVDTLIVGRGGGSIEDLWAFNEECVAMAIFRCETPVISAVGHETDFTIADFVADLRAPTPSAAAELAVFEYDTFENTLNLFAAQLSQSMQALIESRKKELEHAKLSLKVSHPSVRLKAQSETLKQYEAQIKRQIMHLIDQKKAQLSIAAAKLEAQSPLKKVGGGYAFLTDENKKPVCSVNQMTPQTTFFAYLSDGIVQADVTKCMPKDKME